MDFDYKTIEESFSKLPTELQGILTSPHIVEKIKSVATKNGLLIDQMSSLFDITSYIILGLIPASKFSEMLIKETQVDKAKSLKIAEEINKEVFSTIKSMMREKQEVADLSNTPIQPAIPQNINLDGNVSTITKPSHITDLEKAGGFTIEHDMGNGEVGLGSEDLRAMPMRDKWSPFGQTIVPTPTKQTVEASPVITKTIEVQQPIPKSDNIPTEPSTPTPVIIKTIEAKETFIKEPIISKPTAPVVEAPIQKTTEVIEQKVETKIEPEVEVKEEVVSTVPDNLPIEPVTLPKATEESPIPKEQIVLPKTVGEPSVPIEPENNSLAETIINLRRIKDATPKPQIEQMPTIEQPTKPESNTKKEQTPPLQPAPELIVPEKIKLNPGIPKPIEQQRPRSSDPYREPIN